MLFQNIPKKNIRFPLEQETVQPPRHLAQLSIWLEDWTRHFRHRDTIKLSKNKMDSQVIKSHQFSLEKSHASSIGINSELQSRPGSF